jgi:hypothetical protein
MVWRIGVDQLAVMLMDHLGGAMSHLVGEPFDWDCSTGEQLAGIGMTAIIRTSVSDTTCSKVCAPAVFDLVVVVVGASAATAP